MNYCCPNWGCPHDQARWAAARERQAKIDAREARRVLLGNEKHPPSKQDVVVHEIVKEFP